MSVKREILNRLGMMRHNVFGTMQKVIVFEETGITKERLETLRDSVQALKNDVDFMLQKYETIEQREADGDNRGIQSRFDRQPD